MPSTHHSHIRKLQLQKSFEQICSTKNLYHRNYKKIKLKFHSIATQVSAEMAVVNVFSLWVFTPKQTIFLFTPILLQHCISSRLVFFFPTKLLLIPCFLYIFFYFSLTNHTMSTTSFCKTITIQKSDSFMITFHTWGI